MDICGKPMIQHVVGRVRAIPGVDQVVLAVPEGDLKFYPEHARINCGLMEGPEYDVLTRYTLAAHFNKGDVIVRVTGDCPLLCPEVSGRVLQLVMETGIEYATNDTRYSGYPDGMDTQVFTRATLERAKRFAWHPADREHVCTWMEREQRVGMVWANPLNGTMPKLSVDTQDDLDRVRRIMARIPAGDYSWEATQKAIEEDAAC